MPTNHHLGWTYKDANTYLGPKPKRKAPHGVKTHLERDSLNPNGGPIYLVYRGTAVVTWFPSGHLILKTGGWQTATTRHRINEYTRARVTQKAHQWFVGTHPFLGGMLIDAATGHPIP